MTKTAKVLTSIAAIAVVTTGIILAISGGNATSSSTWAIYKKNSDSTFAQINRQIYGNANIKAALVKQFQASRSADSTAIFKGDYSAPVVAPPDTGYHRPKYKASATLTFNGISNQTISLDSINGGLQNKNLLVINNGNNIHITKCYFTNSTGKSIILNNCVNTTIDSCFFGKVAFGIDAYNCTNTIVVNNQGQDLYDVGNMGQQFAHWVQFRGCTRGKINNNKFECTPNSLAPHDLLNVYASKGFIGDSIQINSNWLRGGQVKVNGIPDKGATNGAAGIVAGEVTSSYISCRLNILVNPGYVGIQPQTATNIKIEKNKIFSIQTPASLVGLSMFSYSTSVAATIYFGNNTVKWTKYDGSEFDVWKPGSAPVGWSTNILNAKIDASILPKVIITMK